MQKNKNKKENKNRIRIKIGKITHLKISDYRSLQIDKI